MVLFHDPIGGRFRPPISHRFGLKFVCLIFSLEPPCDRLRFESLANKNGPHGPLIFYLRRERDYFMIPKGEVQLLVSTSLRSIFIPCILVKALLLLGSMKWKTPLSGRWNSKLRAVVAKFRTYSEET